MAEGNEFIMPVSEENAARQFFVEALKQNTQTLISIREEAREDRKDRREDRGLLLDIHTRVVKIESNGLEAQLSEVKADLKSMQSEVDALKSDKDRRDGAVSGLEWIAKFAPWLLALSALAVAAIAWVRGAGQ